MLNSARALGSEPLSIDAGVAAAFDDTRLVVAWAAETGVHLSTMDCSGAVSDQSIGPVAAGGPLLALSPGTGIVVWNELDDGRVAPHLRTVTSTRALSSESVLSLSNPDVSSGDVVASGLAARDGGYYVTGTFVPAGGGCAQPFIQALDVEGSVEGRFIDIQAGGLGDCATGAVPVTLDANRVVFLAWHTDSLADGGTSTTVNDLEIASDVLTSMPPVLNSVPASLGTTKLSGLALASAFDSSLTTGIAGLESIPPWIPEYLAVAEWPMGAPQAQIRLSDAAQPRTPLIIPIAVGAAEAPLIAASNTGGTLGWTVMPGPSTAHTTMQAQRFAYDGMNWEAGLPVHLLSDESPIDRHLRALVPIGETVFFVLWTEGVGSEAHLYGEFASF